MYHSHFGLQEQVFSIAVDPHYLYMSSQHREALAHLLYGVSSGGFVLLSGEVGTGKTTIVRCLLEQLPEKTDLAIVLNPVASAPELLSNICDEFGVAYDRGETSLKVLTDKLYQYLLANHTHGRNTVLLIDEAQLLPVSTLEQVRLLTNLETNTRKLLQIILVGQPELNQLLARPALRQLSQRITARYHLHSLSLEDTRAYIKHRLSVAGMKTSQQLFPASVVQSIHKTSRGIPRLINVLCDRMLLGAYSRDRTEVDESICRQARLEVLGDQQQRQPRTKAANPSFRLQAGGWGAALLMGVVLAWQLVSPAVPPSTAMTEASVDAGGEESSSPGSSSTATSTNALAGIGFKEPGYQKSSYQEPGYTNQADALVELFSVLDIVPVARPDPCDASGETAYRCEQVQLVSWNELKRLNRPAVLRLVTPTKTEIHAALVGLDEDTATLRMNGNAHQFALSELGPQWTGDAVYVWQKPTSFSGAVGYGARGQIVNWIAAQFARLDGEQKPLARDRFNRELAERVRIFQRSQQLQDDGVFGVRTLMALNQQLGIDATLADLNTTPLADR